MHEYQSRRTSTTLGLSAAAMSEPPPATEYWEDFVLNAEYSLDDDETIPNAPVGVQSVEDEFIAYTTSLLSIIGIDVVKYWEVGYILSLDV